MSDEIASAPLKTPRKPERPVFWIIAGPNGSGKSSLYNRTDIEGWGGSVWIINPDLLTEHLVKFEAFDLTSANGEALDRIMAWLRASIDVHQTIGVETVLSSNKYRTLVLEAQRRGFQVKLIYVVLRNAELQLERIRLRVAEGGHDVPAAKVIDRRRRSFEQFTWFVRHVDACYVFDNSAGRPNLAATWANERLAVHESLPTDLLAILKAAGTMVVHHLR